MNIKRRIMTWKISLAILALFTGLAAASMAAEPSAQPDAPVRIDIAHAPAPLFDDPVWHAACDPFVIWNPVRKEWFMYYTQRRGTLTNSIRVDWVHGTAIAIATSKDGLDWKYQGTCQGDHDLSEPLKASGLGPEPGVTWWAPCLLYEGNTLHMWVVLVDGVYTNWQGQRHIVHFTSDDGMTCKYAGICKLNSERVIDPTVYKIKDTWYMVYKDEAAGSHTYRSESKDLIEWTNPQQTDADGSQEAPFVFHFKDSYWLIVDGSGLRVYKSPNGIDQWEYNMTVLGGNDGIRPRDGSVGHHPGIVVQSAPDGSEQCLVFYFTQQRNLTWLQLAELEVGTDGKMFCNRNKYAPAAQPEK
jgi:hypothetical protein